MNPPDIGGGGLAPPNFPFIRGGGAEGGARGGRGGGGRRRTRRRERRNRRRRERRRRRRREGRQFFGDRLWWQTLETKEREREIQTERIPLKVKHPCWNMINVRRLRLKGV